MNSKKSYIPLKVMAGYLVLVALFVGVSWFLYSESKAFSETENKTSEKNSKILKVSNLLSNIYENESLARITIQSNLDKDFRKYTLKTDSLKLQIDSLKVLATTQYQITLLDSVKLLLSRKIKNIEELKVIKNKTNDEMALKNAISDLTKMESSLRKLQVEDFIKKPADLGTYQMNVLKKYVAYLNQNIPDDSSNTLSKEESDSILMVSKSLLNRVKRETDNKKISLNREENKLLQNEILISDQLRKVLGIIEREIILNTTKNYLEREISLKRNNQIVTIAAAVGLFLTLFFLILILNDFSKTESYKRQLEEANSVSQKLLKNREQLISTVSHDLKTPLSTIVGYTELLGNSELTKKQHYFAKNIKGSSEYITKLVQDLLDFTQIEAGKITIEKVPFSLSDIIHEVAKSIQSVYKQKPIDLILDIDENLQNRIIGDPFRLRQIITNIIGNAYKFTAEGFIKIEAKANVESKLITIKIEDSGIGIHQDKLQLIFEEFTQADDTIEKSYGGTGLGLTISKKIVEILGGRLNLNSVLGKGSIFEIQIPLLFDTSILHETPIVINSKSNLTAIVIDDDINLLNLTSEVLKQNNYKVHAFNNAATALEAIKSIPFDFVITDIQMPEMDGFLFLKNLQDLDQSIYKKQPIIAVTGRTDLEIEIYNKAGFTKVISKPYLPSVLLNTLDSILNNTDFILDDPKININESNLNKPFSLTSLKSFITNEEDLKEILSSFVTSTKENVLQLENGISIKNSLNIKEIVHRMGPMFKQIEAHEISTILDNLERNELSFEEIKINFELLKDKIKLLISLLEKEIN